MTIDNLKDVVPLVSVVIPTRNRAGLLSRALTSILNQNYTNFEIIVIDDDSNDETKKTSEDFAGKFKYFKYLHNETAKGAAFSRNIGIKNAAGKYIAFLDDDDEWLSEKTAKQVGILEKNPEIGGLSCWYYKVSGNTKSKVKLVPEITFDILLWENFLGSFSFCMVRNELVKSLELESDLPSSQDWEFWLELSQRTKLGVTEDYLVNYHDHSGNRISNSVNLKYSGRKKIYSKYKKHMSENCKKYRHAYLMAIEASNNSTAGLAVFLNILYLFAKNPSLTVSKISRFVLKRIFLIRIMSKFGKSDFDPLWLTYNFYNKLKT